MRQMRLAKREVKDPKRIREIVESCDIVRIGAVDIGGMFIVPVNFGYEWEDDGLGGPDGGGAWPKLTLYVHSADAGRKAEAFARECDVAIEMDCDGGTIEGDYSCAYSRAYRSIMGGGRIHPVDDSAEKLRALTLIMEHAAPGAPCEFSEDAVDRVAIFRIDVYGFTGKERLPK